MTCPALQVQTRVVYQVLRLHLLLETRGSHTAKTEQVLSQRDERQARPALAAPTLRNPRLKSDFWKRHD